MAGGAADCAHWIRRVARETAIIEFQYKMKLSVKAVANLLAESLRKYRGVGLSVGTMVAGFDHISGPSICYVDSEGSCIPGNCFSIGSGSNLAYGILDEKVEELQGNKNATLEDAVELALWAIRHATHRDGYSGGFINVFHITENGHRHILQRDSRELQL